MLLPQSFWVILINKLGGFMRKKLFCFDDEHINLFWISILLPIISVLSTMGISFLISKIGVLWAVLVLISMVFIVVIAEFLAIIIIRGTHGEKTDYLLDAVTKDAFITSFRDIDVGIVGVHGVYPEEEIAQMELTNHFDSIWLISQDLMTEIEEGVYSGVVQQNLKKGIKYTYFVPKTPINDHRINLIKKKCGNNKNLRFFYLDDDFFFLVPQIDFAIYEPFKTSENGKKGYMGINIEGLSGRYEVLMNHSFLDAMIAKLDKIQRMSTQEV